MKAFLLFLLALCALGSFSPARADFLSAVQPISVTGSIQAVGPTPANDSEPMVKSTPATIPNILKALEITGQNPKKLAFYVDSTTNSLVIADKSIAAAGGQGTPIATVFTVGSSTGWSKGGGVNYRGGDCTTLGGDLPGTYTDVFSSQQKKKETVFKSVINFITWGTIGGNAFIFKGTIHGFINLS